MRPTIRDVAEKAGVSAMAVSVVLNGTKQRISVSKAKAEKIRAAALELNYRPNTLARSLRSKKTGQIALVFQNFARFTPKSTYRGSVMNGVMEALFPNDYTLALCPKLIREGEPGSLNDGRFDGVLWCRPDLSDKDAAIMAKLAVPIVLLHAPPGTVLGKSTFCADNEGAMRRVVNHLLHLGHERIAFVIDPVSETSVEGIARYEALVSSMNKVGLSTPDLIVLPLDHSILKRYSKPDAPHTALVCFSDELAGHVLDSCKKYGVLVPKHVSVVGFDSSPMCEMTTPTLTSLRQPVERMAHEAANHLLQLIKHSQDETTPPAAVSTLYDCELDIRESTAPPRNSLESP